MCKTAAQNLGKEFAEAWGAMEDEVPPAPGHPNIEDLLSLVRTKKDAVGKAGVLSGLDKTAFTKLEIKIRETIVTAVTPDQSKFPPKLPHATFAVWVKHATRVRPVEVFTTNYDTIIEQAMERAGIPVFDGFVGSHRPFFLADSVERDELLPGKGWLRYWKIHGSVNWHLETSSTGYRVVRTGEGKTGQLILPSHLKYDESRKQPYLTMLSRLGRVLEQDDALLVTCGYSFSDQHINAAISSVLETRPRTHVFSLQFEDRDENSSLDRLARQIPNLVAVYRNGAVIGTRWAQWRLNSSVDDQSGDFLSNAFDLQEENKAGAACSSGQMCLGDFNRFCGFLGAIVG